MWHWKSKAYDVDEVLVALVDSELQEWECSMNSERESKTEYSMFPDKRFSDGCWSCPVFIFSLPTKEPTLLLYLLDSPLIHQTHRVRNSPWPPSTDPNSRKMRSSPMDHSSLTRDFLVGGKRDKRLGINLNKLIQVSIGILSQPHPQVQNIGKRDSCGE